MKSRLKITVITFVLVGIAMVSYLSTLNYKSKVILGGKNFNVDVSSTEFTLKKGLSGRENISQNEGMFFIFGKPSKYGFWMREMNFPIDIIWMDEKFNIVHIEKNVEPSTYPTVFYPEKEALYVLEIASGQADILGVKLGDKVDFFK